MIRKLSTVIMLVSLSSCFFNTKQKGNQHTFFIQLPLDSAVIKNIQNTTKPLIDMIIQEELGIKQDKNFPIFFFKKRQAVTIYYIRDLYDNNEPIAGLLYLFLEPILDSLPKSLAPQNAVLTSKIDFFGEEKKGLFSSIEPVILINDPDVELLHLNQKIKKAAHHANKEYKRAYHINLYDIDKSEKYPYLPHISLGHLRINYIKYLINDPSKENKIIERIKQRIIKIIAQAISNLDPSERKLSFDKIGIYDTQKKKFVKDHTLQ